MFARLAIQISQTCAHEPLVSLQQFWWILRFLFGISLLVPSAPSQMLVSGKTIGRLGKKEVKC